MVEIDELVKHLGQSDLFGELDDELLRWAAGHCTIEYQRAGTRLVEYNQENSNVFVIVKGAVELHNRDGELVGRYAERDALGVVSAATGRPTRSSCDLIEDSVFCRFGADAIGPLRSHSVEFDRRLISIVEDRAMAERSGGVGERPSLLTVDCGSLVQRDPVTVSLTTPVDEAAQIMTDRGVSSVLVVDEHGVLVGIMTDRDIRTRIVAANLNLSTPVVDVMTADPVTVTPGTPGQAALLTMTDNNIHHLPIVDPRSRPLSVISINDLHVALTSDPVFVVGTIGKATDVEEVVAAATHVPSMVQQLMAADARAETVGRLVTSVTDAACVRLAELAEEKLGAAPMPFAFVCFGSQARMEQTAYSDQDNALILSREPTDPEAQYFSQWARFVCDGLAAAGYRLCPGDIMATNPRWSVSVATWRDYVTAWVAAPTPEAVLNAAVFFDARHLYGDIALTRSYRSWSLTQAAAHPLFLGQLAANGVEFKPPIGFFRRFVVEKDGEHRDRLDLKRRGVTPVIELARVLALSEKLEVTNTFDRLRALGPTPALAPDDALDLTVALEHVGYYRLQHQRRQIDRGEQPDNYLDPNELSRLERDDLKRAFVAISAHQDGLRRRFNTGSMG